MEPAQNPNDISHPRMAGRFQTAFRGWVSALPFVLSGPAIFWLVIARIWSPLWSWPGFLLNDGRWISLAALVHLIAFLILGLPLFIGFWSTRNPPWRLSLSLPSGLLLGVCLGFAAYSLGALDDPSAFVICGAYGMITAFGCWLAGRRSKRRSMNPGWVFQPAIILLTLILTISFAWTYVFRTGRKEGVSRASAWACPIKIPSSATNIHYAYERGMVDGRSIWICRYTYPDGDLKAQGERYMQESRTGWIPLEPANAGTVLTDLDFQFPSWFQPTSITKGQELDVLFWEPRVWIDEENLHIYILHQN